MNIVPSIEMIPAKYSPGILLCQEPMDGSGDLSVTRATTVSTRFNAAGFIETVTSGLPRLDYYTSDGTPGCPALLVEPSGTNIILRSEQFDNSYWTKSNGIATPTTETAAPDGNLTAETYVASSGVSTTPIVRIITLLANTTYTLSLFVKRRDYDTANIRIYTVETGFATCSFNLSTGTASGGSIFNFGNGWYRVSVTLTTAATVTTSQVQLIRDAQVSNGVAGIYIWGAQLETGSIATSYIPTTTGPVARDADVINKTGVSGLIGQTEGTMYAEFEYKTNIAERRLIALSNGTTSDRIMLWTLNNILYAQVEAGSIILANPITEGYHKVAFAYQQSGVSGTLFASLDGGGVVSGTSAAFPASLTDINIGKNEATATSTFFWNARIRAAAIYKTRLPNYLLESATSQIQSYSALASSLSYTVV